MVPSQSKMYPAKGRVGISSFIDIYKKRELTLRQIPRVLRRECVLGCTGVTKYHRFLKKHSFAILLISLFVMLLGSPFASKMAHGLFGLSAQASIAPMVVILTISSVLALWATVKNKTMAVVFGGAALLLIFLSSIFSQDILTLIHLVGQLLFLLYVTTIIANAVFRAPVVNNNILCGAACLYMLVGVLIGFVYCLIEFANPNSFQVTNFDGSVPHKALLVDPGWLIYFSFTTLTTVGFGDILPTSPTSRAFAALEAVLGQIMVVVIIARLVGLNVAQVTSTPPVDKKK